MQWVPHKRETWPWHFGRLKKDILGKRYLGYWNNSGPVMESIELKKGQLVRIVMVSRFGDIGVTDKLDDITGYVARVNLSDLERER